MRFVLKTLLVLFAVALLAQMAGAASFTATLDRDAMILGEQATLSLKFEGVQPQDAPNLPVIPGLRFQYVGQANLSSIVNFQTSSSITYNYLVEAQREGEFTIPGMRADVGGQQVSSAPLKIRVTKIAAPTAAAVNAGNEVAFLKLNFAKEKTYVGQSAVAQLELYLRDDVSGLNGFQLTSSPTEGFSAGKMTELPNQRRRVQVGNRVYTLIPLAIPLTVVKTGALTLGPFNAAAVLVLSSQNQNDPFSRFFNQGEQKQVALATEAVKITSLPLPAPGMPTNFTGAVGNFTMNATAGPTAVTVGDPITLRVQISGSGSLDSLTLPMSDAWHAFKAYPPTAKIELTDQFGFQGTKTFEQIITPLNSDVRELPPMTFTFFNPDDGRYHTLTHPATPLTVRAAGATPLPALAANKHSTLENQPPPDLLPIKEKLGALATASAPLVTRPLFLVAQSVPVLAFLAAFIWRRRADQLANNPRLRRQRAVAQLVRNGVNDLKKYAAANQPDEFFALLFRLLQDQLGERLDCPASAITENVIEEHPVLRGVSKATLDVLNELFQLCNQARYAPVRGSSELNSVAAKFEKTVGELQEVQV
jgi:hypothetical protein